MEVVRRDSLDSDGGKARPTRLNLNSCTISHSSISQQVFLSAIILCISLDTYDEKMQLELLPSKSFRAEASIAPASTRSTPARTALCVHFDLILPQSQRDPTLLFTLRCASADTSPHTEYRIPSSSREVQDAKTRTSS